MSILVLGAGGQVGREIAGRLGEAGQALTRSALDITRPDAIARALDRHHPKVLINAAAYTAVDRAEAEPDRAEAINRDGAAHLATACAQRGIALLHLSTDYVFDGRADAPYTPADAVNPLGQYGRSKAAGEAAIRQALPAHLILRTSWVFGRHGGNFVKTMLRLARDRDALNIVDDQIGGPTPAAAIAEALLGLARTIVSGGAWPWGTYHYAGAPAVSWRGFADVIFAEALQAGLISRAPQVRAITTAEYPTPALRPLNSQLDMRDTEARLGLSPPDWQAALQALLRSPAFHA